MKNPFYLHEMPVVEMKKLGIIDEGGSNKLENREIDALLAGRRTGLMQLRNLMADGFYIDSMDVKMSLSRNEDGRVSFKLHPVYKNPQIPFPLEDEAAELLVSGYITHHYTPGKIYEYDEETKEFLLYDPDSVIVPDRVNGFELSAVQQKDFRWGNKVTLPDGTQLMHKITQESGVLATTDSLIFRAERDGMVNYLLLEGLGGIPEPYWRWRPERTPAFIAEEQQMRLHTKELIQTYLDSRRTALEADRALKR